MARELGMSVNELLRKMDSAEISEWIVFFDIENESEEKKKKQNLDDRLKAALGAQGKDGWQKQK